ncbi:TonB-dependent receptor [Chryseolinea serpens]|uniref:TonB-dependent receptor n=1 Tax=Chryseolinea serpens TaxID=947013 RepID=A0A1M5XG43_9BACT|nr:TonB-dependent receptor [Chryseolinea serpens]SHH98203.1 TonB-dependent receptor [Chryseolinea serpens]
MLRSILLSLSFLIISFAAWAQNGTIGGIVTDAKSGEAIVGANVIIQGTQVGAVTDVEGKFTIANVKPGTYTLAITFITYKANIVADVVVESAKRTDLKVPMQEDSATELTEIVVAATREINNDMSLINAIKESKLVVSGISAEQIIKLPDNDAAQVMKRVPGVTIVDNRFVLVRGVPDRYNQVMINGAIAPSTEVDKRTFAFDLIPSGAIDQLLIYKSATPDLPGDFAGGVIQVKTKQTTSDEYTSFGLNFGYRANTTLKDFNESAKSPTDFLGFDNGFRSLPSGFPSVEALKTTGQVSPLREQAGKSLSNQFDYTTSRAPVDYGFNFGYARNVMLGRVRASTLTSLNYSVNYQYYKASFNRYTTFDTNPETKSDFQNDFKDSNYSHETKISLIHNWLFNLSDRNKIEFKNLLVQIGDNKTTLREGHDYTQLPGLWNNNSYYYLSRFIYSGQLEGTYSLKDNSGKFNWMLAMNYVDRSEPDYRKFRRNFDDTRSEFRMILPPGSNLFDANRYFSSLTDNGYQNSVTFEKKFGNLDEKRTPSLKAGYFLDYKKRAFSARYVSYLYPANFDGAYGNELSYLPINTIFSQQNMFTNNADGTQSPGFAIQEGSDPSFVYHGKTLVTSGFVMGNVPVGKFDIGGGVRVEHFDQKLETYLDPVHNVKTSILPSANIAYNLTERSLLRVAYSKTVNRPEFRELAPFLFYQFEYNLNLIGNPTLKPATIDNIDLRWELYPNPGELISFGAFYKNFKNPIEFYQQNASGNIQFSYQNAPKAYTTGVELEVRKSLASLGVSKFLRNLSVNINSSLMKSEVDMGPDVTFQKRRRPLQGQSPYVINSGLYYNDPDLGYSVNIAYNVIGNRIMAVGSVIAPSWIERPRNAVDLQVAKEFKNSMEIKLNVQNVLNAKYRIFQDNDENQKIDEKIDDPIQVYQTSQLFTLSWSWKFMKK